MNIPAKVIIGTFVNGTNLSVMMANSLPFKGKGR